MYIAGLDPKVAYQIQAFEPGTLGTTSNGNIYRFIHASSAMDKYDAVRANEVWVATGLTASAGAKFGTNLGVVEVSLAASEYGWMLINGVGKVNVLANTARYAALNDTATKGVLDDAVPADSNTIVGMVLAVASGGAATAAVCVVNFPSYSS